MSTVRTIVVGLDTSEDASAVLAVARAQATAFGAEVVLVHVAEPEPTFMPWDGDLPEMRHQRAVLDRSDHRSVQAHAEVLRAEGLAVRALQFRAPTADGLVDKAQDLQADLIIVGSHRRGPLMRALLGSVSRRVIDHAPCPVLVVPTG